MKAITKFLLITSVLFVAAVFAVIFAVDALRGPHRATITLQNQTDETIASATVSAFGTDYPVGKINAHESSHVQFGINGEGGYLVVVEFASGRKLKSEELGYLTSMSATDVIVVRDDNISDVSKATAAANTGDIWSDPILGLGFSPNRTHFERMSPSDILLCKDVADKNPNIYAAYQDGSTRYLIVGGLTGVFDDQTEEYKKDKAGQPVLEPSFGVVVAVESTDNKEACRVLGQPDDFFFNLKKAYPVRVIDGLAADAFRRYQKAFGEEGLQQGLSLISNFNEWPEPVRKAFSQ